MGDNLRNIPKNYILGDIDLHIMMKRIHYLIEANYETEEFRIHELKDVDDLEIH